MAHESFEDAEVAKLLNDNFICIKVDREEHRYRFSIHDGLSGFDRLRRLASYNYNDS